MFNGSTNNGLAISTSYKVVLPFYVYAGLSFLVATVLLLCSSAAFLQHYFHPRTLAITHLMALGWGTMIILGASHQLVPVLIEGKLFSNVLAYLSFGFSGIGIPLLVYSFYEFDFGWIAQCGAILINLSVLFYLVNMGVSMSRSKGENVHAVFAFTGTLWLLITTLVGLCLIYNFSYNILSQDSLSYLPLHAHLGIVGWFLLMIIGVSSRLIPLFLISKYNNQKLLWWIYSLINIALISFIIMFLYIKIRWLYLLPLATLTIALVMFGYYCYQSYRQRIRKRVDEQLRLSLLSVLMMGLPLVGLLIIILFWMFSISNYQLTIAYGFVVFFGWITSIIFGMTFKTLPFIIWNKVYHHKAGLGKTPNPKDLFSDSIFYLMCISYLAGFVLFIAGVLISNELTIRIAAALLLLTAILYNGNLLKTITHKEKRYE